MKKYSSTGRILRTMLTVVLTTLLLIGSITTASIQQPGALQASARLASKQQVIARLSTPLQSRGEEAMTASPPVELQWADVPGKVVGPLQEKEVDAHIDSDIDPETMRRLKREPYRAALSMPTSYQSTEDSSTKGEEKETTPLAPNLLVNFESIHNGGQLDGLLHRPPDCAMAAGQNHVMAAVNSMFAIYTKAGTLVSQASYASFFSSVCSGCSPFDPRVVYDSLAGRWILLCVNGNPGTPGVSNYLVAVSQTSDPTGSWWLYSLNGILNYPGTGENTWADFPQLGCDGIASGSGGAVYVTSNQFTFGATPSFRTSVLNILPKSSLYAGGTLNYWRAWDRLNGDGSQAFTLSPAMTYGNPGAEFLINTRNGGNFVSVWRVIPTFPPTPVNWTLQSTNTIGTYTIPPDAAQPGGCELMATNDSRISTNSVWRNNKIYAAFTEGRDWGGGGGTVAAIRLIRINTTTNTTEQNETFGADGFHYFFPALATDGSDNEVVTFARASSSEFGSIRFTGRLTSDSGVQASALLKSGALCITGGRWGDYFSAVIDPADNSKVWIYGEWAKDVSGVSLPWDWGSWIGQVQFATSPSTRTLTVASANPASGVNITVSPNDTGGQGSGVTQFTRTYNNNTNVSLTASSTAGGNNFQKWQRDGLDFSTSTNVTVLMDANHTMTAFYQPAQPPIYQGFLDAAGCGIITGWAWDALRPNTVINVDIYDGSTLVTTIAANLFREDIVNAGIGNGFHGFSFTVPLNLKNGQPHNIRAFFGGTSIELGNSPRQINCSGVAPSYQGFHDGAGCGTIAGWAWDINDRNNPINVDIYDGATLIATVPAIQFRPDLLAAGIGNGFHGFSFTVPASLKDGQPHSISVKFPGTNTNLNNTPRTISCSGAAPIYQGVHEVANCNVISGWAWDQRDPNSPINVAIFSDGQLIATVLAIQFRQDLVNAGIGNGYHAFSFNVPASLKNGQPHSIRVRFSGTTTDLSSTPRSITCTTGLQQLLGNPGFESGAVIWNATPFVITNALEQPAHGGVWKAWLNGYGVAHTDSLSQSVTIPSTATSATLNFWLHIETAETTTVTAFDTLKVQVRNASGTVVLSTLATYSNLNQAAGYLLKTFNLLSFKGQTITIYFEGIEDSSLLTSFVVDDATLNIQ